MNSDTVTFHNLDSSVDVNSLFYEQLRSQCSEEKYGEMSRKEDSFNSLQREMNFASTSYEPSFYTNDIVADAFSTATAVNGGYNLHCRSNPTDDQSESVFHDPVFSEQHNHLHSSSLSSISDPDLSVHGSVSQNPFVQDRQTELATSYCSESLYYPTFDEQESPEVKSNKLNFDLDADDLLRFEKDFEFSDFADEFSYNQGSLDPEFLNRKCPIHFHHFQSCVTLFFVCLQMIKLTAKRKKIFQTLVKLLSIVKEARRIKEREEECKLSMMALKN